MNILLFPGSFSPYTDGHYGLISRYISEAKNKNLQIDKIVIFMSSKPREGIGGKSVFKFISQIYSNDNRFEIKLCEKSPINDAYAYVHKAKQGDNFIFLRSSKDDDTVADDFYKDFGKGGKFATEGKTVTKLEVNDSPLIYKNRQDKYNNQPISASVVRNDLRNKDFDAFLTSYQNIIRSEISINQNHLKNYFNEWCKVIEPEGSESKL